MKPSPLSQAYLRSSPELRAYLLALRRPVPAPAAELDLLFADLDEDEMEEAITAYDELFADEDYR